MDHESCVKRLIWKFWVWWPFMIWPWPWPEENMKQFHYSVPLPGPWKYILESFGRNMLRLRSLRSATWIHPILTFDLTFTWHVTSFLNFPKWFWSVSSRSFECRLAHLSTAFRFWDSWGSDPTPRLWWVQKQFRRWQDNSAAAQTATGVSTEQWVTETIDFIMTLHIVNF